MALFESIPYTILVKVKPFEIREYDQYLLATTATPVNPKLDTGFNNVFNYISGENEAKTKISMTVPVVSYEEKQQLITGFYVPSKYAKQTVPKPTNAAVSIQEVQRSLFGVVRFRGRWTEKSFQKQETKLLRYLEQNGYQIISQRYLFRYQPPFIPAPLRRNEIAFQIQPSKQS